MHNVLNIIKYIAPAGKSGNNTNSNNVNQYWVVIKNYNSLTKLE